MLPFFEKRNEMVDAQLAGRDITDERVLKAFREVPRHMFVKESLWDEAYCDYPLPIGDGQTMSQPYMVALMTQCLCLKGNEKVLEIGTGSGYQAAILGELAKEVYSIERHDGLAKNAQFIIQQLGYKNIHIKTGDGTEGWNDFAAYDGIIVTAGSPSVPKPLKEQLAEKGRLVIPIGSAYSQVLTVITRFGNNFIEDEICGCVFVPLIGRHGWNR
jgi:protein-L-isoaspartate(D-aspartate) O-methyltransferase